jgi:hypothetical protein
LQIWDKEGEYVFLGAGIRYFELFTGCKLLANNLVYDVALLDVFPSIYEKKFHASLRNCFLENLFCMICVEECYFRV